MILLNSKKCKKNFQIKFHDFIEEYNEGITNYIIKCPCCNSTKLVCHGYYKRNVVFEDNGLLIYKKIRIKRVKCKECGKTHALIPIDIIPYKPIIFSIIIKCLYDEDYYNQTYFSYDVRQKWIRQFRYFIPYIRTIIDSKLNIYHTIKQSFYYFYQEFYYRTNKIILMRRYGCFNIGLL